MSFVLSNHLKAVFLKGNILDDDARFSQYDCLTAQRFDYNFERTCNSKGIPFGSTTHPVVSFSLRFMDDLKVKSFFSLINSMDVAEFSFVFGVTFDENRRISSYENAVVVRGYVVGLEQDYTYNVSSEGEFQRLLNVEFLALDVTYAGSQSNKTLVISRKI